MFLRRPVPIYCNTSVGGFLKALPLNLICLFFSANVMYSSPSALRPQEGSCKPWLVFQTFSALLLIWNMEVVMMTRGLSCVVSCANVQGRKAADPVISLCTL